MEMQWLVIKTDWSAYIDISMPYTLVHRKLLLQHVIILLAHNLLNNKLIDVLRRLFILVMIPMSRLVTMPFRSRVLLVIPTETFGEGSDDRGGGWDEIAHG